MSQPNLKDEIGNKYGKLTVIERVQNSIYGTANWLCQCECGNTKICRGSDLRRGEITHCGCEKPKKRITNYFRIKNMSINEMAEYFAIEFRNKYVCSECEFAEKDVCSRKHCIEHFKNYLLQEVEKW